MSQRPIQMMLRFRSADFHDWKAAFDEYEHVRARHGALGHQLSRSINDPQEFLAVIPFTSHGGAVGYAHDPDRHPLKREVFGSSAMRIHSWEESIHELIDAGGYGYTVQDFGRAWSPVYQRLEAAASSVKSDRST
jgi:hypothetical protein